VIHASTSPTWSRQRQGLIGGGRVGCDDGGGGIGDDGGNDIATTVPSSMSAAMARMMAAMPRKEVVTAIAT
jgi:hypothetical protein